MMRRTNWFIGLCGGTVALAALLVIGYLAAKGPARPVDVTAARVALGQRLLAEPRLSADGRRSCFSCHQPGRGFTDGRAVATPGGLNTPPLWG
ncbi:MAG: cytochrome c peroxidase, partial [Chloroflexaceae bacterium]